VSRSISSPKDRDRGTQRHQRDAGEPEAGKLEDLEPDVRDQGEAGGEGDPLELLTVPASLRRAGR
jgi:hypothetical protein